MIVDNKFFAHNGILVGNGNRVLGSYDVQYDVTVSSAGNGTASADKNRGHYGDIVNLSNTPESHYAFDHYTVNGVSTTNQSFALQSDANVVAYFTRTPGNSDWYYDDDNYTAKVQNRTIDGSCESIYAHQRSRTLINPVRSVRFWSWSNYGVCRCYWSGDVTGGSYPAGICFSGVDGDYIKWLAKNYYTVGTHMTNVKVSLVANFNTRSVRVYTNDVLSFTVTGSMPNDGVFLGITENGVYADPPQITNISMKIFEEEADALAFARFE